LNRFYSGITTLEVEQRLQNHINKIYDKSNFTQKADDWILFHSIKCEDISQARKMELYVKKKKSAVYIRNIKKYPELEIKLLEKFKSI
jgi:putative endonuclease